MAHGGMAVQAMPRDRSALSPVARERLFPDLLGPDYAGS